jgi:hypothetical protein
LLGGLCGSLGLLGSLGLGLGLSLGLSLGLFGGLSLSLSGASHGGGSLLKTLHCFSASSSSSFHPSGCCFAVTTGFCHYIYNQQKKI